MDIFTETELLARIRDFLARHEMAPTTFGRKATGEPQLISSIEGGRSPSLKIVNRVVEFMNDADAEAATRAKLEAPLAVAEPQEEEVSLPFGRAPVNVTGASSATSSSTSGRQPPPEASNICPSCFSPEQEPAK